MEVGHAYSKIECSRTQLTHWKANQLKFCKKNSVLSPIIMS